MPELMSKHLFSRVYTCPNTCLNTYSHVYTHVRTHVCTYIHSVIDTQVHTRVRTHACDYRTTHWGYSLTSIHKSAATGQCLPLANACHWPMPATPSTTRVCPHTSANTCQCISWGYSSRYTCQYTCPYMCLYTFSYLCYDKDKTSWPCTCLLI